MRGKSVVILGGGVGGLVAASELRRLLPTEHRIVLVDQNPRHAFAPSFLWLMTGGRRAEQVVRDLRQLVRPGVAVTVDRVEAIDLTRCAVRTRTQTLSYDYLVVALGAQLASDIIPGLAESAHTFYTFEGALRLRNALVDFQGGTVAVVVSSVPYKCPGAPHEGAMLIADALQRRGLRGRAEVHLFTPEPQPMPVAGPVLGEAVRSMLEQRGVSFHPLHKLARVDPVRRELFFEGKDPVRYDLLVAVPPHRSPRVVQEAGLTDATGWVPVDRNTLATRYENVYAVGDVTAMPIPGRWKPDVPLMLPKAGVFAHAQAKVVAGRIATEISGRPPRDTFCGDGYCVLEAGSSRAGFAFGNFFAEPSPRVELRRTGRLWHMGKVLFEQWWLSPHGPKREALRLVLTSGSRLVKAPVIT